MKCKLCAVLVGIALGLVISVAYSWVQEKIEQRQSPLIERVTFPWER